MFGIPFYRISNIKIFDPACGSGNFLIIAYKELRKIEMAVFKALNEVSEQDVMFMSNIKLSQFYGIEIDDFAHEIALLSLWLTEHQMNQAFKGEFGSAPPTLPLNSSGNITQGNSLQLDWNLACPKSDSDEVYICGNPPFLGTTDRTKEQSEDMKMVFSGFGPLGYLDYVACWFWKGARYIANSNSELALVSTNSICQGVQVETLWPSILKLGLTIHFAFQSFPWRNSARDNAGVHVVVVGLTSAKNPKRRLFKFLDKAWRELPPKNISPYLIEASNIIVKSRTSPFSSLPKMVYGNKPVDGGFLMLTTPEKNELLSKEPGLEKWVRKILGAEEFINNKDRWCLWLVDATEDDIKKSPELSRRTGEIQKLRIKAGHPAALKTAKTPHLFMQICQPKSGSYILVPAVTSENRYYIPLGIFDANIISNNRNYIVPGGTLFELGILSSAMHMDWMRIVAGRLESRYAYSAGVVYNTFPWPQASDAQRGEVERLAEHIILLRENYTDKNLSQLYDPDSMPKILLDAHHSLDNFVDRLYRDKPFKDSSERLEYLFKLYEKLNPESRITESNGELW